MRKHTILNSPRLLELRRKKQRSTKRKILLIFVLFLALIIGLSFLAKISDLNIKDIKISGNKIIETKEIEEIVRNKISGNFFWLFPKTNFLIYPKHRIETELKNKFKRIKNITVNNKDFENLEIIISEYEGEYLWCGATIPVSNEENTQKCYFLDSEGYIFDKAPYFSGQVYFKFYGDSDFKQEDPLGKYFLRDKFAKLIVLKDTIRKLNLNINSFSLQEFSENDSEGNFYISKDVAEAPKIIFKIDSDYQKIAENLQAALSTEPLHSDLQKKLALLLYLDLRFGNKVYYKFK
jgi:hypothetical protein